MHFKLQIKLTTECFIFLTRKKLYLNLVLKVTTVIINCKGDLKGAKQDNNLLK